jgi:hypothetical protein
VGCFNLKKCGDGLLLHQQEGRKARKDSSFSEEKEEKRRFDLALGLAGECGGNVGRGRGK